MVWLLLQNSWLHQVNQAVFPHSYFKSRAGPCFNQSWWFDNQLFFFFWFGRDFKPCGSHSASKYRPSGMLGNKSHPQASGSLIHFLVCCYIPTLVFCWNIEASPLNSISHLLLPQEMGFCVHWHYWPKSLKPVPQLQALTLASAGSFEPSGTVCLSKKN